MNTGGCLSDLLRDLDESGEPLSILFCDQSGTCGALVAGSRKTRTYINPKRRRNPGLRWVHSPCLGEGRDPAYPWGPELDPCGSKLGPMGPQGFRWSPLAYLSSLFGSPPLAGTQM